jgi:hypothetical protein
MAPQAADVCGQVVALLCVDTDPWTWDGSTSLSFYLDGTGEVCLNLYPGPYLKLNSVVATLGGRATLVGRRRVQVVAHRGSGQGG